LRINLSDELGHLAASFSLLIIFYLFSVFFQKKFTFWQPFSTAAARLKVNLGRHKI